MDRVLEVYDGNMAVATIDVMKRRYNLAEREMMDLYANGAISTITPSEMTPKDIESIYRHYRNKPGVNGKMSLESVRKDMVNLNRLCLFDGNRCFEEFRVKYPACRMSSGRDRLPVFTTAEMNRIFNTDISKITNDGLMRSYGMLALYFGAGVRSVELRNALVDNIFTTDRGTFIHLDVVKGIGSYGKPRDAMVLPKMIPMLNAYLGWRKRYLDDNGFDSPYYLFVQNKDTMASDQLIKKIRPYAEKDLYMEYDGRKCRRSYGQYMKDCGVPIEAISVLMGHSSTKITEGYYARMPSAMAMESAMGAMRGL